MTSDAHGSLVLLLNLNFPGIYNPSVYTLHDVMGMPAHFLQIHFFPHDNDPYTKPQANLRQLPDDQGS